MSRHKKEEEKPNHGIYHEAKVTITDIFGNKDRKSFYSKVSVADAKRQGQAYQAELLIKQASGSNAPEKNVTFKSWAKTWLETYKKGKVKDSTYRQMYCNIVDCHLAPYFGKKSISAIKPIDIQKFFDECERKYSLETIKKMRTCLGAIFDTAIENGYAAKSPMTKHISIASKKAPAKKHAYTEDQYNKLEKFCKENNGLDVLLLLTTAITRSELLGIKWENLDFENKLINIEQGAANVKSTVDNVFRTEADGLKNEYRRRQIPVLDDAIWKMLEEKPRIVYIGTRTNRKHKKPVKTEYVFYNKFGGIYNPDNWYQHTYKPFMQSFHDYCLKEYKEDIPILHPHELRHTCATHWKDKDVDLFSIAKLGGWVDLNMLSKKYGHNNIEKLKQELSKK